jgi:Fur family ferric uptake transcriptional regulator
VHGLEDAVAADRPKIVGAQNGSVGGHNADAEESYHTLLRHAGHSSRPSIDLVFPSSLADELRSRGLRLTAQRQLVLEAVYALGHATPDQVHAAVAKTAAGVNITTVYRALELLEELGLVTHAHLSHGAPTYHAVGEQQHVHLVCRVCGHVTEVASDLLGPLAKTLEQDNAFLVDIGHVALFGVCGECEAGE